MVATGFRPELDFLREVRLSLDPALECPPALAPLIDPNEHSCGTVRPHGARELAQPEPGFYFAGMKSYGRAPTFLMLTGYEQVRSIVAEIAGDHEAAAQGRAGAARNRRVQRAGSRSSPEPDARRRYGGRRRAGCCCAGAAEGGKGRRLLRLKAVITRRLFTIIVLGSTQTLAWASSYYLPAVLADDDVRATPACRPTGSSASSRRRSILTAVMGPKVGRTIDAWGGNGVLAASNLLFAFGLVLLQLAAFPADASPPPGSCWRIGMGLGLYDAAFAALGRIYGTDARGAITGITLIAGFASTIGWPLTAWGASTIGWRETCLAWAARAPLRRPADELLAAAAADANARERRTATAQRDAARMPIDRPMILLGLRLRRGVDRDGRHGRAFPAHRRGRRRSPAQAIAAGALIGPAQVAARLLEAGPAGALPSAGLGAPGDAHPSRSASRSSCWRGGGVASSAFAVLHGSGNGIITIARGTVPLALFGPENYGYRLGLIGAPARFLQAGAPLGFALLIEHIGDGRPAGVRRRSASRPAPRSACCARPAAPAHAD